MHPIEILGFVAGGLGISLGIPQALHIRRVGHTDGVSQLSWILMFAMNCGWTSYGLRLNSPSTGITNALYGCVTATVVFAIIKNVKKAIPLLIGVTIAVFAAILLLPEFLVSVILTASVFAQIPQIKESLENLRQKRASAVSLQTLYVTSVSVLLWATYGALSHHYLMILTSAIAFTMTNIIIQIERRILAAQAELTS